MQLLSQANVYLRQHPADANMTLEELKQMVNSMSPKYKRLQEFVRHWLNGVLDAEWYWYRFEYQARGSIHCHGCEKLKNDPDIRELRNKACVAFLEGETTRYEMSPDDFEFLCGDVIRQGEDAEKLLRQYVDWLVTTFNEELPDENWRIPDPHPSAVSATTVDNRDNDYHRLVNTVERHTRCSPAYCLKQKRVDLLAECRFGFPKPLQEETELSLELVVGKNTKSVESELHTKRNDQRLNSHNRVMLENWRANVDLQVIVDEKACARYMAKYAAKGEPRSESASEILKLSVSSLQNDVQVSSAFKKAMIQVAGDRDMAAQETAHMLLSLSLVGCTFSFVTISLDNGRKVNIDAENEGDEVLQKSALQEYAERTKLKNEFAEENVFRYSDETDRVHDAQCGQIFENDRSEVDPDDEEEGDYWMLLCRINQDYGEAGNRMSDNEAVDLFETTKEAEEHGQHFREDDQQCVIDPETLNEKQRLAYDIITSQNGDNAEPVYMIVCGTQLAQGDSLQRLQLSLEGKRFLIIDEMSMIGHKMLSWLDNRLRAGTGKEDVPFGGMSVILMWDFGQLPPVGDKPMYVSGNGTVVSDHGHSLYLMFESVTILDQVMRQAGDDHETVAFRALLMRMRNGEVTGEDWKLLLEHSTTSVPMDQFTDAIRLYFDKKSVAEYNYEKLLQLGQPVAKIQAKHSGHGASAATSDEAGGLDAVLFLSTKAEVMLTCNLWAEVGLCNGSFGTIEQIWFAENMGPPNLPIAVLVHFHSYTGPAFLDACSKCIPVPPKVFEWVADGKYLSRQQVPLRLRYAMTIHKSQGQTLTKAVVDLGKGEKVAGCTFVATSRVRSIHDIVFEPMTFDRLKAIGRSKNMQKRLEAEQRLKVLAEKTVQTYNRS
ncbi:ATP-dependent DNA helicase PIF1-like [Paramuricea clavata]|uniref:ATP-dependent DNA helicase n=1 Tax=Paramuricea clavata TaxID=317549 RepID=A0A6S7HMN7_PARCT|nr:ATP-dependent DNA helicase PIF1-like [Paramuricea clavata]